MAKSFTIIDGGIMQGALQRLPMGRGYVVQRSRSGYRAAMLDQASEYYPERTGWDEMSEWMATRAEAVAWAEHEDRDGP